MKLAKDLIMEHKHNEYQDIIDTIERNIIAFGYYSIRETETKTDISLWNKIKEKARESGYAVYVKPETYHGSKASTTSNYLFIDAREI